MRTTGLVPDPAVVALEEIVADDARITFVVRACRDRVDCPVCAVPATRVHSWYIRRLGDLPWQGLAAGLRLRTRRWFCDNPRCERLIFTGRLPTVATPHSSRTTRLVTIVLVFGVAVGGAPGARLLGDIGIPISGDTLRRSVGTAALPDAATPRVLGVDDWSLKRGCTYATILVDLEHRRPVDLLPDASSDGFAAWLKAHPGVEIVCRDCGRAYAEGARQGAPGAVQVADRWHLLANLGDMLKRLLTRHYAALRSVQTGQPPPVADASPPAPAAPATEAPQRATRAARERQARDARREARYGAIQALRERGYGVRAIGRHLLPAPGHRAQVPRRAQLPAPRPASRTRAAHHALPPVPARALGCGRASPTGTGD